MKEWQSRLLWLFIGITVSAILFLVTAPPRGESIELLPAPSPAPIMVHVDGAVIQPGVYALPRESRVQDAIHAAGGLNPKANRNVINLAAPLQDGDRLVVPEAGTPMAAPPMELPGANRSNNSFGSTAGSLVNINTATAEQLQTLPGIGVTRAQDIIDYRQEHGNFTSVEDLKNVKGIGDATFENLKMLITVK